MNQSVAETQFLAGCLKGNRDAMDFVQRLFDVFHFWDDLIDRDRKIHDDAINAQMYSALVELPMNPFYRQHQATFMPLIVTAIHNWRTATDFERGGDPDQRLVAFVLRSSYVDILVMAAHIVGGNEWAQGWVPRIRDIVHGEKFVGFTQALKTEEEARHGVL